MSDINHQNTVDIAVLKSELSGVREQAKAHSAITKEQFDKVMAKLDELSSELIDIKAEVAELRTSAKVGWKTMVAIGTGVSTIIGLIIAYFK